MCHKRALALCKIIAFSGFLRLDYPMKFSWERIGNFGSLRERDCFLSWMRGQIAKGVSEEVKAPAGQPRNTGDRWFKHIQTDSLWRLVSAENPRGPGFWPEDGSDSWKETWPLRR
jgi:hypothetical protein